MTTRTTEADVSPDRAAPLARLLRRFGALTASDVAALRIWLVTRLAVLALTWPAAFVMRGSAKSPQGWLSMWQQWDAVRLAAIAQYGYFGPPGRALPNQVAFFPGYPFALDIVHFLVRQWTVSGLLVSFIAGGVAVIALSRIAELDYQPRARRVGTAQRGAGQLADGRAGGAQPDTAQPADSARTVIGDRAVLFMVVSPAAIFLAAGYSESLFLAFALTSWLAARNQRWVLAVLLAGGASFIRINGLFLCVALVIEILRRADGRRLRALAAFIPALAPLAGYELYLHARTGDWLAWVHAEKQGWQRQLTNPVDTFKTAWTAGFGHEFSAPIDFVFQLEILAVLIGVGTTVALLAWRRWAEAAYVGLTIAALATSIWYESVPRALLLLWPIWCGLAMLAARWRWVSQLYLAVTIPISMVIGLLFLTGNWAG
jgi:Mannosyltransferase (PIG-V)